MDSVDVYVICYYLWTFLCGGNFRRSVDFCNSNSSLLLVVVTFRSTDPFFGLHVSAALILVIILSSVDVYLVIPIIITDRQFGTCTERNLQTTIFRSS
jgi:hypothetical protein